MTRAAVIMPCFGQDEWTDQVIEDLRNSNYGDFDLYLMDNKNDYEPKVPHMRSNGPNQRRLFVYQTPQLRWLKGTNFGTVQAKTIGDFFPASKYELFIWLNNDVRLSVDFVDGLIQCYEENDGVGIYAPAYDDVWPQQHSETYRGPAEGFQQESGLERPVGFVDGACMAVTAECIERIGLLDEQHFPQFGWGGDLDYCIRARQAGFTILVTELAYFNHLGGGTNKLLEENYQGDAGAEMTLGMLAKYGNDWQRLLEL